VCVFAAVADGAQRPSARKASAAHLTVELLSAAERPVNGQQVMGLRFSIEPDWHIYWHNPGASGSPPEIVWQLPTGVSGSPLQWPLPEHIEEARAISYGYHGQVVLPFTLTIDPAAATAPLTVRASVRWLVCRDSCVSGRADLEMTLPPDSADRARLGEWAQQIADAMRQVPRPAPPSWHATARSAGDWFVVDVFTGRPEQGSTIYPLDASQIGGGTPPRREPLPDGVRFTLRKSQQLMNDPATLRLVLALEGGRVGILEVPLVR
jgi:thiol:disulfide interchange protein DsbD